MSKQYEKLHIDDATLSRILQEVENADLSTYRDRPEYLQKERPELASVGEPASNASKKIRSGSFGKPGFRTGMSRMLISTFTVAAAAAVTLLIAIPFVRTNSVKMQTSEETGLQTSGNANIPVNESEKGQNNGSIQASEDTDIPVPGAEPGQDNGNIQAPGDTDIQVSGAENGQDNASPAGEYAEAPETSPSFSAASLSPALVAAAFRDYYDDSYTVELSEETSGTVSLTVSRDMENGTTEKLTVTVDLLTGETETRNEAGSQVETGTVSEDGIYTVRS